jgi:hypothetical protein
MNAFQFGRSENRAGGFTMIEVVLGLSALLVAIVFVGLGLQTGFRISQDVREDEVVFAFAQGFADRLVAQPYGSDTDPTPRPEDIDELFDTDEICGPVTLKQLAQQPFWAFSFTGAGAVPGVWRIEVGADLDGDGTISGNLETSGEALLVEVFYEDRLILTTVAANDA